MKSLILSCGGSPEPLIFCINDYTPDFICFLCSNDSIDIANDIAKTCNLSDNQFTLKVVENHESLEDSFAKSREIINELKKEHSSVHVDFTGGTKPMVAGLVLAAIGENCTYSYIGSQNSQSRDKNGLGVVQDGFELIKNQRDPYDVFAVLEFEKGMDFFNKYQFEAAKFNFKQASEKLELEESREIAELLTDIMDVYDSWDKFNNLYNKKPIKTAFYNIVSKIDESETLKKYFVENYPKFHHQLKLNHEFLEIKISRKGLIKMDDVKYYLPDLLNNAYRRIEEGKYDDAVARLYRSIELIAQVGLTDKGIIKSRVLADNKEFKIDLNKISQLDNFEVKTFIYELFEYERAIQYGKSHFGIGSDKSFQLLSKFDVEYATDYLNDKELKTNIGSRNGSILAHGLNPISKKKANKLYSQVLSYSKRAFPDLEKYMSMSEFPKFE